MSSLLKHYKKKISAVGWLETVRVARQRIYRTAYAPYERYRAKHGQAAHAWNDIVYARAVNKDFTTFLECNRLRFLSYVHELYSGEIDINTLIKKADLYTQNCFDILGSGLQCFTHIPWHTDIRLYVQNANADCHFDLFFYKDIQLQTGMSTVLEKDVKVPWELSRFQHLLIVGRAYEKTHSQIYADAFVSHINNWWKHNPYLCGVNWLCPMEVALRVINWIIAWEYFKHAPTIPHNFWQRFVCSLYDHMHYLEHNWELYDGRTNNHYLSNLVGYLYMCWFFSDIPGMQKKRDWCYRALIREMEKQVFEEGTSYEGSTHYHVLVTELLCHAYLLSKAMGLSIDKMFEQKLLRMFEFIDWCKVNETELVTIGDNDSGRVLYYGLTESVIQKVRTYMPLPISHTTRDHVSYYPAFGVSIIKTPRWHMTLRHHAYAQRQPSGHFHNDWASITLAVDGIPVIIDPGSYVYTASAVWRNYFRSVSVHNTFYIENTEPVQLDALFTLAIPERTSQENIYVHDNDIHMHTASTYNDINMQRLVHLNTVHNECTITDTWQLCAQAHIEQVLSFGWNFTLAPHIVAQEQDNTWVLIYCDRPLIQLHTDHLQFSLHAGWISPSYGSVVQSTCLRTVKKIGVVDGAIRLHFFI